MKKIFLIPLVMVLFAASSCKKENPQLPASQDEQSSSTENSLTQRQPLFTTCADWRIGLFQHGFLNETRNFRMVELNFCPGNTVVLHNDFLAINGSWYIVLGKANPQYLVLDCNFQSPENYIFFDPVWAELEGTWQIQTLQYNLLRLHSTVGNKTMVLQKEF